MTDKPRPDFVTSLKMEVTGPLVEGVPGGHVLHIETIDSWVGYRPAFDRIFIWLHDLWARGDRMENPILEKLLRDRPAMRVVRDTTKDSIPVPSDMEFNKRVIREAVQEFLRASGKHPPCGTDYLCANCSEALQDHEKWGNNLNAALDQAALAVSHLIGEGRWSQRTAVSKKESTPQPT
jgi:hypothetical protein